VHDRTNIRKLDPSVIGEPITLVVVDCSFIALAKVLPHLPPFLADGARVVALVKPQFELDAGRVGKGGVVRSEEDRAEAVTRAGDAARAHGFQVVDREDSPVAGREGNREIFLWLRWATLPP
jgi:23S rRNA (cytidine1920-2'-O)/16S rRNA (cytidine1409-2'-O)-methyltransferase